jgi:hypothetical protein
LYLSKDYTATAENGLGRGAKRRKICLKLFNAFEITGNLQAEAGAVGEQMVERPIDT